MQNYVNYSLFFAYDKNNQCFRLFNIQPSGLLAFLESAEAPPAAALEEERVEERDNLQLAQAAARPRAPHWEALERQVKYVEKHLEVSVPYLIAFTYNKALQTVLYLFSTMWR